MHDEMDDFDLETIRREAAKRLASKPQPVPAPLPNLAEVLMRIEGTIERIADSLEVISGALTAEYAALSAEMEPPKAKKPKAKKPKKKGKRK